MFAFVSGLVFRAYRLDKCNMCLIYAKGLGAWAAIVVPDIMKSKCWRDFVIDNRGSLRHRLASKGILRRIEETVRGEKKFRYTLVKNDDNYSSRCGMESFIEERARRDGKRLPISADTDRSGFVQHHTSNLIT